MRIPLLIMFLSFYTLTAHTQVVGYEIIGVHTNQFALVTKDTLKDAKTLSDIFERYDSSWVGEYIKVELYSNCKDEYNSAFGRNDTLTQEQLSLLNDIDVCCRVDVKVDYLPKNSLKDNPPRQMNFFLNIAPIVQAKFPGGIKHLNEYLKTNTLDKIAELDLENLELATISFVINAKGQVGNAKLTCESENNNINKLLLEAIYKMPLWEPALNAKGDKINQDFEFNIGTSLLNGC